MNVFSAQRRKTKAPSLAVPVGRDLVKQAGEDVNRPGTGVLKEVYVGKEKTRETRSVM